MPCVGENNVHMHKLGLLLSTEHKLSMRERTWNSHANTKFFQFVNIAAHEHVYQALLKLPH